MDRGGISNRRLTNEDYEELDSTSKRIVDRTRLYNKSLFDTTQECTHCYNTLYWELDAVDKRGRRGKVEVNFHTLCRDCNGAAHINNTDDQYTTLTVEGTVQRLVEAMVAHTREKSGDGTTSRGYGRGGGGELAEGAGHEDALLRHCEWRRFRHGGTAEGDEGVDRRNWSQRRSLQTR